MNAFLVFLCCGFFGIAVFATVKIVRTGATPDFRLSGFMPRAELGEFLTARAGEWADENTTGAGLDLSLIVRTLRKCTRMLTAKVERGGELFDFERWILDNFYVIEGQIEVLRPQIGVFRTLPAAEGLPRIYRLASEIIKRGEGTVKAESFAEFVEAFQKRSPLKYREIIALPLAVRFALLEFATVLMSKCIVINRQIACGKKSGQRSKIRRDKRLKFNSFVFGLNQTLVGKEKELESFLLARGMSLGKRLENFRRALVHYNTLSSRVINSMRQADAFLNMRYLIGLSRSHGALSDERIGIYRQMTLQSQCDYLARVDAFAKKHRLHEYDAAVRVARTANDRGTHIGAVLLDAPHLILGKTRTVSTKAKERLYTAVLFVLSIALPIGFAQLIRGAVWLKILCGILAYPPLLGFLRMSAQAVAAHTPPRLVPSLDFGEGIPDGQRAMMVVSSMIADANEMRNALERLNVLACANPDRNLSVALLADLPASNSETDPSDDAVIAVATEFKPVRGRDIRVYIRKRTFNKESGRFCGYERKRGVLMQLNAHLCGESGFFRYVRGSSRSLKYIIALDADTFTADARALVEAIAHPQNSYAAVITPVVTVNPAATADTLFARAFGGAQGISAYACYDLDSNFRLFGRGNFCGKGIYDIVRFRAGLDGLLPEGRILSHDFIEGAIVGTAHSAASALDGHPSGYYQWIERLVRWVRGDVQLLPYVFKKSPITSLGRLTIWSNAVCSLTPISLLFFFVVAVFGHEPAAVALFGIAFCASPLLALLTAVRLRNIEAWSNLGNAIVRGFARLCVLPHMAACMLYAHAVTLWRLIISHKNLLVWRTFSQTENHTVSLSIYGEIFAENYVFAAACIVAALFVPASPILAVLGFGSVFATAPLWICAIGAKRRSAPPSTRINDRLDTEDVLRKTWLFFEENWGGKYLIPDNVQLDNGIGAANRTSPTNIGMSLAAVVCAFLTELISRERMEELTEKIISAVESLPKWKGHLFNWYDCDGVPLAPRYVSSVDSGNFCACLMLLRSALGDGGLSDRIDELAYGMDFGALFNKEKGLLRIGYSVADKKFDDGHYDLLASEAALTYYILTARGVIDQNAWFALGRRRVKYAGSTLYSWGGGMFEYLMPYLFLSLRRRTLLDSSCKGAVRAQIKFARKHKLAAYGISESQYDAVDNCGNYQYRAAGVNNIALKNFPPDNVISPYSIFLSIPWAGKHAAAALRNLDFARGEYGFFEAVCGGKVLRTYMAHHQGMIMLAAADCQTNGGVRRIFMRSRQVQAAEYLLWEQRCGGGHAKSVIARVRPDVREAYAQKINAPAINPLCGGNYVSLSDWEGHSIGAAFGIPLVRESDGAARVYIIDGRGKENVSAGAECVFEEFRSIYRRKRGTITAVQEIFTDSSLCGEVRRITLHNSGKKPVVLQLQSYQEVTLCPREADAAHPAFSGLFVRSERDDETGSLIFERSNSKQKLFFAHAVSVDGKVADSAYQTNKANYYGTRKISAPDTGDVLDPIASLSVAVELGAGHKSEVCFFNFAARELKALLKNVKSAFKEEYAESALAAARSYFAGISSGQSRELRLREYASILLSGKIPEKNLRELRARNAFALLRGRGIDSTLPLIVVEPTDINALRRELCDAERLAGAGIKFCLATIYDGGDVCFPTAADVMRIAEDKLVPLGVRPVALDTRLESSALIAAVRLLQRHIPTRRKEIKLTGSEFLPALSVRRRIAERHGVGGFTQNGAYTADITLTDTPKPYSNIISSGKFGTLITGSGGGYIFGDNSRERKITAFCNSPAHDVPGELILLREPKTGAAWTPVKLITNGSRFEFAHSPGATEFWNNYNQINTVLTETIAQNAKIYILKLHNTQKNMRRLKVSLLLNAVLGDHKIFCGHLLTTENANGALKIINAASGMSAYVSATTEIREEYITVSGAEFNFAATAVLTLPASANAEICFAVSDAPLELTSVYAARTHKDALKRFGSIGNIQINTPDNNLDRLVNTWLPYQILSARFYARCGYYQAGGAFGFRDQLQDAVNLLHADPEIARKHILLCARHQFADGDVQHWWHFDRFGVRTRISDDLLFLPWAVAEYISFTGDSSILSETAPYLVADELPAGIHARLDTPEYSSDSESVYLHCLRAILHAARFGAHGLALIGGGDWNDGMDEIGTKGRGESVWLSMFLYYVAGRFAEFCVRDEDKVALDNIAALMRRAVAESGFRGKWFLRAFDDLGNDLGGADSVECKIDLLCQAWSALSGIASDERIDSALDAARRYLVDEKVKIIKLLTPPLKRYRAGYISDYPVGVRENGGQYTHAAVWFVRAMFNRDPDEAARLLGMLNPLNKTTTEEDAQLYGGEPYVLAADVYSHPDYTGMAGWTYYTGAAGHFYSTVIEAMLGIKRRGNRVFVRPNIPSTWNSFNFRIIDCDININVKRTGRRSLILDGVRYNTDCVMLTEGMRGKTVIIEI